MKVLLADDSKGTRLRLGMAIESHGHEIVTATNGEEALKIMQSDEPPEIAFMDWEMPEMEGLTAIQQLRKSVDECDIHRVRTYIIMITARSSPQDISEALASGADDYLTKPWNKEELGARLQVAERTIALQQNLKHQVCELESVLERHNLLEEILTKRVKRDSANALVDSTSEFSEKSSADTADSARSDKLQCIHSVIDLLRHAENAFTHLGIGTANISLHKGTSSADPLTSIAWVPLILRKQKLWVDFIFELDNKSALLFFQAFQKKIPTGDEELNAFLSRIFHVAATSMKPIFGMNDKNVILPAISSARTRYAALDWSNVASKQFEIAIDEIRLLLTVTESALIKEQKSLSSLSRKHILAAPLTSANNPAAHILEKNIAVDELYLEKLRRSLKNEFHETMATVYLPSSVADQMLE